LKTASANKHHNQTTVNQKLALEQIEISEAFSGVVLVTQLGETLYEKAQGWANPSDHLPNHMVTRFQTASGCKGFTAVAILQLAEAKQLNLDDRAANHIPWDFPHFSPDITIRQLLTHSSGITSYFEEDLNPDYEALWADTPMYQIRQPADFLPLFQHKVQKFPPGDHFEYNDGGFILLGLVVESASKLPFIDYVKEKIFKPAGMNHSGYFYSDRLPENCAQAIIQEEDGTWRTNTFAVPIVGGPDGGAYVTASDMAKFWQALAKGRLIHPESLNTMFSPRIKAEDTWYGLGVWIEKDTEGVIPYLEGWDPGVAMISAWLPQQDITITILENRHGPYWEIYTQIRQILRTQKQFESGD
jgi:CubicO group peptidase (beta-lactamase class C family)